MIEYKRFDVKASEEGAGSFEAVLSAPIVDRDQEVVDANAFEPLPARIPIHVDHEMSVRALVGYGEPYYEADQLKVRGQFGPSPLAQEVREQVKAGVLDSMSVGFLNPLRDTDADGVLHLRKAELLEASFVTVPANVRAVVLAAKDAKRGARNSAKDGERLQQIHDLAVANGATCSAEPEGRSVSTDGDAQVYAGPARPEVGQKQDISPAGSDPERAAAEKAAASAPADETAAVDNARITATAARALLLLEARSNGTHSDPSVP